MKYSRCDNANNICADSLNMLTSTTTTTPTTTGSIAGSGTGSTSININSNFKSLKNTISPATSSGFISDSSPTPPANGAQFFSEEFRIVEQLFEKWSDCERTVVMYALLKRLRYPCLKFLQYSIDNNLTQQAVAQSTMNAVISDINANNPSYLQNLLNTYNNLHNHNHSQHHNSLTQQQHHNNHHNLNDTMLMDSSTGYLTATKTSSSSNSSSSVISDKESMPCYGSAAAAAANCCDERKIYTKKEDILNEIINIIPLLKPGNEDAKIIYLSLMPNVVKDTIKQIVPPELVQQIFSYLLIHPAVTNDDRRSLNSWLRQLEDFLHNSQRSYFSASSSSNNTSSFLNVDSSMINSICSASSSCSSSSITSSNSMNVSALNCGGNNVGSGSVHNTSFMGNHNTERRNSDWQTIAPPSKLKQQQQNQQQQQQQIPQLTDWCDVLTRRRQSSGAIPASMAEQLCDNFNGITLNELSSSQSNSLGLASLAEDSPVVGNVNEISLVNGVVAAAASAEALFSNASGTTGQVAQSTNPIINIISNSNCDELINDDHDTSFSKNGTDFDFEPPNNPCNSSINQHQFSTSKDSFGCSPQPPFGPLYIHNNPDQLDVNRWNLDSKIAALKTRRSNSLTTQAISTSASSSNSSVITVNDNCSNSTEDLAQFANKPRSFSLSIENQQRGVLMNGGSDTRLDDFKPNKIKFQTRNVGMSSIGAWLKSLRLHKYIELFHNMTYEEMLQITEDYLQSVGVTKGASHKLALCIEKLKERTKVLNKLSNDLVSGKVTMHKAVEDLTNIVLTPMKPIEVVNTSLNEDNVALTFLRVVDLLCSMVQRDPYSLPEDDNLSSIIWILDRAIHCEAFINHINQLKDLKFQISKLKIAFAPRLHYNKNGSGGGGMGGANLNKSRWNSKGRKCDSKNGSNDRINYRKNSGDMINLPIGGGLPQQQQQQSIGSGNVAADGGYQLANSSNSGGGNNTSFKNPNYSNYSHQAQTNGQQAQQQQPNGRSLNNLIMMPGGPQQPQKMVFKPGHQQGVLSMTNSVRTSADNLQMETLTSHHQQQQQQHHHNQPRKGSLSSSLNSSNNNSNNNGKNCNFFGNNINDSPQQQQQQQQQLQEQQQQGKKTMATVVMVSNNNNQYEISVGNGVRIDGIIENVLQQESVGQQQPVEATTAAASTVPLLNNNKNNQNHCNSIIRTTTDDHNLINQLELLAAAAAAVAASGCHSTKQNISTTMASVNNSTENNCNHNNNNNTNNNHYQNQSNNSNNICSNCYTISNAISLSSKLSSLTTTSSIPIKTSSSSSHIINQMLLNENLSNKFCIIAEVDDFDCKKVENNHNNNINSNNNINDIRSLDQLETLCLQMTEQAIN